MKRYHCTSIVMAGVTLLSPMTGMLGGCRRNEPAAPPSNATTTQSPASTAATIPAQTRVFFDPALQKLSPEKAYDAIWEGQRSRALRYEERMDLAMSLMLQSRWPDAAATYKGIAASCDDPKQKAAALVGASQCLANAQKWREGAEIANQVLQLEPRSREVAIMRYAFWMKAGDGLEIRCADDAVKAMDVNSDGLPTMAVLDDAVIIVAIVIISYTSYKTAKLYAIYKADKANNPETARLIAEQTFPLQVSVGGITVKAQ